MNIDVDVAVNIDVDVAVDVRIRSPVHVLGSIEILRSICVLGPVGIHTGAGSAAGGRCWTRSSAATSTTTTLSVCGLVGKQYRTRCEYEGSKRADHEASKAV
jgi:hypothetical protein